MGYVKWRSTSRLTDLLPDLRVRFRTKDTGRWWPRQSIPWLGATVDAGRVRVEILEGKREEGLKSLLAQKLARGRDFLPGF